MYTLRTLVVAVTVLLLAHFPAHPTSAQETLVGSIPTGSGVALVHWSGGPISTLQTIVEARGCRLRSVWRTTEGAWIGYLPNGPDRVNAEWDTRFGLDLTPGPLLLSCATIGFDECQLSAPIIDHAYPGPGWATSWEAIQEGLAFFGLFPVGKFVEVESSGVRAVWEIVANDGIPVARFRTERNDFGWYLSSFERCIWS